MSFSFARQALLTFGIAACAVAPAWAADGKAVYDKTCVACHAADLKDDDVQAAIDFMPASVK